MWEYALTYYCSKRIAYIHWLNVYRIDWEILIWACKGVFGSGTKCNGMSWFRSIEMEWFRLCVWYKNVVEWNGYVSMFSWWNGMEWKLFKLVFAFLVSYATLIICSWAFFSNSKITFSLSFHHRGKQVRCLHQSENIPRFSYLASPGIHEDHTVLDIHIRLSEPYPVLRIVAYMD